MKYLHWRQLVGVAYTEEEAKALAFETEVMDGPNDEGEMFARPGRLSDKIPQPYANEQVCAQLSTSLLGHGGDGLSDMIPVVDYSHRLRVIPTAEPTPRISLSSPVQGTMDRTTSSRC